MTLLSDYLKEITSTLSPKTVADYSARLEKFRKWSAGRKYDRKTALEYLTYLRDDMTGKASLSGHKTALSAFYTWLVANDHLPKNPVRDLSIGNYRSKHKADDAAFTEGEYQQIKLTISTMKLRFQDWQGAVIIAWHTGLRLGDICCLEKEEVDLNGKRLRIMPNKTKRFDKRLEIPLAPEVLDYLTERMQMGGDRLFPHLCEQYSIDGAKSLSKQFERICTRAGIKEKSFHCWRHSYLSRLMNAGVPLSVVSSITGNTLQVLSRYSHVRFDEKVKALQTIS